LACSAGHDFPVVDGIPVLVDQDLDATQRGYWARSHEVARVLGEEPPPVHGHAVDPYVARLIVGTHGNLYRGLTDIARYPVPTLPDVLGSSEGERLLDVGCNWGRWSIAAAQNGYLAIGLDPSLGAVLAAKRVADKLGLSACFIVADARFLPFRSGCANVAFSYSVLQHFSRSDAEHAITEMGRVLHPGGRTYVQMPTVFGVRCIYHQLRRRFREAQGFEVRYWTIPALRRVFANKIGPTSVSVDCYFGIGLQASDRHLMPFTRKLAINGSELLRKVARMIPGVSYLADSVYVESIRRSSQ